MSLRVKWSFFLGVALLFALTDLSLAQPGVGPGGRGGLARGGFGGNVMGLLMNREVQEELQLVEDQLEDIEALQTEMRDEMRSMFQGMRDLDPDERQSFMEDMRKKMEKVGKDFEDRASEILLPHQFDRLKQLQVQAGNARGIENNQALIEQLGLTEDQVEEMKAKAEEVNRKLQEKIAKLREQAQDEVLSVLSSEQQKKFKELIGDSFDFSRGFNARPQQQRGGDRGGARRGSDF